MDANDKNLTEFKKMEQEILKFYTSLFGTNIEELAHVDIEVLRKGDIFKKVASIA